MALFNCNEITQMTGNTAAGGIAGAPQRLRSSQSRMSMMASIATYTIPAAAAPQNGDTLELIPLLPVTSKFVRAQIRSDALGAGATVSMGKIDPNDGTKTDAVHYMNAKDFSLATVANADKNLLEQVGADPVGDGSAGQGVPGAGQAPIIPTITFGGANPAAAANITVLTEFGEH